jgi:hypothetical protein
MAQSLEEAVAQIREVEKRKHITPVGFAVVTVYKDGKQLARTATRDGYISTLSSAIGSLMFSIKPPSPRF